MDHLASSVAISGMAVLTHILSLGLSRDKRQVWVQGHPPQQRPGAHGCVGLGAPTSQTPQASGQM